MYAHNKHLQNKTKNQTLKQNGDRLIITKHRLLQYLFTRSNDTATKVQSNS